MRAKLVRKWVVAGDDNAPRLMSVVAGRLYAHFQVFDTELVAWRYIAERAEKALAAARDEVGRQFDLLIRARNRIAELEKAGDA